MAINSLDFSGGASGKEPTCQCRRHKSLRFNPWVRKIPWEEGRETHSSIPAWRIPWTEKPRSLWFTRSQRIGRDWSDLARVCTHTHTHTHMHKFTADPTIKREVYLFPPWSWAWSCHLFWPTGHKQMPCKKNSRLKEPKPACQRSHVGKNQSTQPSVHHPPDREWGHPYPPSCQGQLPHEQILGKKGWRMAQSSPVQTANPQHCEQKNDCWHKPLSFGTAYLCSKC